MACNLSLATAVYLAAVTLPHFPLHFSSSLSFAIMILPTPLCLKILNFSVSESLYSDKVFSPLFVPHFSIKETNFSITFALPLLYSFSCYPNTFSQCCNALTLYLFSFPSNCIFGFCLPFFWFSDI